MEKRGKINVQSENIFPIIKKFLYTDHDIFLREMISNAVDATQKLKTLSLAGEVKGDLGDLTIRVELDKKNKLIKIIDKGIGLTDEEVEKYINQIAFSGAEEFLSRYKDYSESNPIIGHFGLGFYSAFMVSDKVELISKSYKEGSKGVKWECDGSPDYSLVDYEKEERGTEVILHISEDSEEFLEEHKIRDILKKYCKFLPIPISFGYEEVTEKGSDGNDVKVKKPKIINNTMPAWVRKPSDLEEKDYMDFYRELYPFSEDPLFYIHLNVDYPFNLTGILYFPKIKRGIEFHRDKIQLYSRQVFITDNIEGIVPEFLTLLHGVIDSPDIPLNVSRSQLQSDSNVKKISSHITKKVADKLEEIFKNKREEFEKKWDDIKVFIEYGIISDEKFYDRARKFCLLKNTEGKYFTLEEYNDKVKELQKNKNDKVVYLYSTDKEEQYSYISLAKERGYDVLLMDGQLDTHFINSLEYKLSNVEFKRVDADVIDKLIEKGDNRVDKLSEKDKRHLRKIFRAYLRKGNYSIEIESLGEEDMPIVVTKPEFMRRMKDMSALTGGMYGEFSDQVNIVLNGNHKLIESILNDKSEKIGSKLEELEKIIEPIEQEIREIDNNKDESTKELDKQKKEKLLEELKEKEKERDRLIEDYAKENVLVKQLIDLGLLSQGMLKGEDLMQFIKRSVAIINK